jgi:uncharacterized protein (TIGR03435 family)
MLVLTAAGAWGQGTFEVASVKPQAYTTGPANFGVRTQGNRLHAEHSALEDLIEFAYGLPSFQISGGPAWVRSDLYAAERYEVDARAPGEAALTAKDFRPMLQALLAERFQLKVRRVEKDFPAYNLVVARNGFKLKASAPDGKFSARTDGGTLGVRGLHITAKSVPFTFLVGQLNQYAGRPVIDKTGLTGTYDFEIEWVAENGSPDTGAAAPPGGPSIFTAVQETLGLRLEPGTARFDTLVIESVAKPSEN